MAIACKSMCECSVCAGNVLYLLTIQYYKCDTDECYLVILVTLSFLADFLRIQDMMFFVQGQVNLKKNLA